MLTFGSLFSGIGGFDLGFERAGMRPAWQVEIDERCNQVLAHHFPGVQRYGDVKDVGRDELEPVDLICGGFPCQDLSVAGNRKGLAGERSGLWFEFLRIIKELKPEWVVIENVPGLLSSNGGRDLAIILSGLENCGYWWVYRTLDAQFFGVPQRRRRVFIVGCLTRGRAQQVLFERESSPWDIAPGRETGERVAASITSGVAASRGVNPPGRRREDDTNIVKSLLGHHPRYDLDGEHFLVSSTLTAADPNAPRRNGKRQDGSRQDRLPIVSVALRGRDGGATAELGGEQAAALRSSQGGDDKPYVLAFEPLLLQRYGVRRLTPLECERLQGFPDSWSAIDGMSDSARYRMLGNAVAVPVAEWIGRRIETLRLEGHF